jgi:hypothetical protein
MGQNKRPHIGLFDVLVMAVILGYLGILAGGVFAGRVPSPSFLPSSQLWYDGIHLPTEYWQQSAIRPA